MQDTTDPGTTNTPASFDVGTEPTASDDMLWTDHPGQVINLPIYAGVVAVAAIPAIFAPGVYALTALLPLAVGAWFALLLRFIRYELTEQRLRRVSVSAVFTRRVEEIELYRVEDTAADAPLLYRLNGRGNIKVLSTDRTASTITLRAIADYESVRRKIRDRVEAMRRAKGARLVE